MRKRKSTTQPEKRPTKLQRTLLPAVSHKNLLDRTVHNEHHSVLARLPPEVRQLIWNHILGDRLLHFQFTAWTTLGSSKIVPMDFKSLRMRVCIQERDSQRMYDSWREQKPPSPRMNQADLHEFRFKRLSEHSHHYCSKLYHEVDESKGSLQRTVEFRKGLALLHACKLTRSEAQHTIWTKNIFSFSHYDTLRIFIKRCTALQRSMLKSLRISFDLELDPFNAVYWKVALPENDLKRLEGLRDLHIYLREGTIPAKGKEHSRQIRAASMCVDNFRVLPLTNVTMIIDSTSLRISDSLSHSQRVEWAVNIRNDLLQPASKRKPNWDGISWSSIT